MLLLKILIFTFVIVLRLADARPVDDESSTTPSETATAAATLEDLEASTSYTTAQPAIDAPQPSPEVLLSTVEGSGLSPSDATDAVLPTTTAAGPETVVIATAGTPSLPADVVAPTSTPTSISSAEDAAPPTDPTSSPSTDLTSASLMVVVPAEAVSPTGPITSPELTDFSPPPTDPKPTPTDPKSPPPPSPELLLSTVDGGGQSPSDATAAGSSPSTDPTLPPSTDLTSSPLSPEVLLSTVDDSDLSPLDATDADLPTTTAAGPETVVIAAAETPSFPADVVAPSSTPSSVSSAEDAAPPTDPTSSPPTDIIAAEAVPPAGPTTSPELTDSSTATATLGLTVPAEALASLIQTEIATPGPVATPTTVPTTTTGRTAAATAIQVTSTAAHTVVLQAPGQSEMILCYELLPLYYRCDTPQATYIVNLHM